MRISDWSSDVCSSDLAGRPAGDLRLSGRGGGRHGGACPRSHRYGKDLQFRLPSGGAFGTAEVGSRDGRRRPPVFDGGGQASRSEESRVGKEGVRKCRSWWPPYPEKIKQDQ